MKIFVTDLDNTLIYSYKKNIGNDKILVETKNGKELSFMSKFSHDLLKKIDFIPLTTRSLSQYRRIEFFKGVYPEYALVANGGILLNKGEIDNLWYEDSLKMIECSVDEMDKGMRILEEEKDVYFEIKKIDGLFVFTKSHNIEKIMKKLKRELKLDVVDIYNYGEKLYIFPKNINKGTSLERLKKNLNPEVIICAGDSEMDVSMLKKSDISIFPEQLKNFMSNKKEKYTISEKEHFADKLLLIVKKIFEK